MPSHPHRHNHRAGSVLILVILAIVFLSALAAGVVSFLGTANMDTAVSNLAEKVYYNAESGFRYLVNSYDSTGDTNGNGFIDDDRAAVLIALNGATVNLPGNLGSFSLDVRPYWFITSSSYAAASSITVRFPGSMPTGYTPPATGILEVEDNSPHAYTAVSVNAPYATFTLADTVTIAAGKSVYMTLTPTGAQNISAGGSLTISSSTGSIVPDRAGQIEANGVAATYRAASFDAGTNVITLSGLSAAVSVGASDRVVLKKCAQMTSTGRAGISGYATADNVEYNMYFGDAGETTTDGQTTEMNDETDFSDPLNDFTTGTYVSADGTTETYVVTKQVDVDDDPDSTCTSGNNNTPNPTHIRYSTLYWDKNSLLASLWQNGTSNHLLSYDVQVKSAWGYQLDYGAGGLDFRLHESATSDKYNTLGLSFMKFKYKNSCSVSQGWSDEIPDAIKPTVDSNESHKENLANHCLLVLWIQEVSGGKEHRDWIAYRDLNNELCVRGMQNSIDGQCVTDDSTLMVRVMEKMVNGTKASDITVYYGDASNPDNSGWWSGHGSHAQYHPGGCGPRTPNSVPYDYGTLRQVYYKNSTYSSNSPFPTFPPLNVSSWSSTYDYFSFVESGSGASIASWSRINPSQSSAFQLQADGGTLRTTKFLTPSSGSFPTTRDEIGLHNFGGGASNQAIGYKDFSLRFMIPGTGSTGGVSGAVMR